MARELVGASSQSLTTANAIITAYPYTLAAWARATTVAGTLQEVLSLGGNAVGSGNGSSIGFDSTAGRPRAYVVNSIAGIAVATAGPSNGQWAHLCGVFTNATSRDAYYNGGSKGSDTTNLAYPSLTSPSVAIGRRQLDTPSNFLTGAVAEAAIWNVALDAAEVAALGAGISPLLIRPTALVAYWPLFGNDSPEPDRWNNRYDMTVTGATKADHVRQFYPG